MMLHPLSQQRMEAMEPGLSAASAGSADFASPEVVRAAGEAMRGAPQLVLLLDYDGTLVPFAETPALAAPDAGLLELLVGLTERPRTQVHVVSGRSPDDLDAFLGGLPLFLHGEHGQFSRPPKGAWSSRASGSQAWRAGALEILRAFAASTPGAMVEEKRSGLVWHYRRVAPEARAPAVEALEARLAAALAGAPVEVLPGNLVIELRAAGAHKGRVAADVVTQSPAGTLIAAFGDDRTDEDLFAALPDSALTVHVGPAASRARLRLPSTVEVRGLLRAVLR